jgi:hypothetical protein
VSVNAVRMKIRRGTLASEKDEDGNVWVLVSDYSSDDSETTRPTSEPTSVQVEDLREQIAYLREIISTRDEELRRKDTIIMQMAQRIPELEPAPEQPHPSEHSEPSEEPPQQPPEPEQGAAPPPHPGSTAKPQRFRTHGTHPMHSGHTPLGELFLLVQLPL